MCSFSLSSGHRQRVDRANSILPPQFPDSAYSHEFSFLFRALPPSSTTSMAPNKQRVAAEDFRLQARRHNVPFRWHPQHPVRTVTAQRLLVACPAGAKRSALMHDLYRAYWVLNEDVADDAVLAKYGESRARMSDAVPASFLCTTLFSSRLRH